MFAKKMENILIARQVPWGLILIPSGTTSLSPLLATLKLCSMSFIICGMVTKPLEVAKAIIRVPPIPLMVSSRVLPEANFKMAILIEITIQIVMIETVRNLPSALTTSKVMMLN